MNEWNGGCSLFRITSIFNLPSSLTIYIDIKSGLCHPSHLVLEKPCMLEE